MKPEMVGKEEAVLLKRHGLRLASKAEGTRCERQNGNNIGHSITRQMLIQFPFCSPLKQD